jgi:hypothetical protein
VSPLRRHTRIAAAAVGVAAVFISAVGTAGAAPFNPRSTFPFGPPIVVPSPFHITRIVPSDRVNFDILALPNRAAEVTGGINPSFVNPPGFPPFPPAGWTQVTHAGTGHYCLNGAGYNYPAVVSVANRNGNSAPSGALVQYDSYGRGCSGVGVFTYQITS